MVTLKDAKEREKALAIAIGTYQFDIGMQHLWENDSVLNSLIQVFWILADSELIPLISQHQFWYGATGKQNNLSLDYLYTLNIWFFIH